MNLLQTIARWVVRGLIALGVFLGFAVLVEVLRAYQVLASFHPVAGWVFALLVAALAIAGVVWLWVLRRRYPALPVPPTMADIDQANHRDVRRCARYVIVLLARMADHHLLDEAQHAQARTECDALRSALRRGKPEELRGRVRTCVDDVLPGLSVPLDEAAERHIRQSVRDVTVGVAVSPWHSVDLVVVIYRNARMVLDVVRTYTVRPGARAELRVLRDVAAVVATVNFLNYGSRLFQNLGANIPFLGRFTDDIAQGLGAGLLTSVAGHAAVDRCRAFRGWQQEAARARMAGQLGEFLGDLRQVATTDLAATFRERVWSSRAAAGMPPPDEDADHFVSRLRDGLARSMDDTARAMDQFVRRPVVGLRRGVAETGYAVGRGAYAQVRRVLRPIGRLFRRG